MILGDWERFRAAGTSNEWLHFAMKMVFSPSHSRRPNSGRQRQGRSQSNRSRRHCGSDGFKVTLHQNGSSAQLQQDKPARNNDNPACMPSVHGPSPMTFRSHPGRSCPCSQNLSLLSSLPHFEVSPPAWLALVRWQRRGAMFDLLIDFRVSTAASINCLRHSRPQLLGTNVPILQ